MVGALLKENIVSNDIATACSFASSLTTLSSQPQRYKAIDLLIRRLGRLSKEERREVLANCEVLRL